MSQRWSLRAARWSPATEDTYDIAGYTPG
jgi:hypothetical protein